MFSMCNMYFTKIKVYKYFGTECLCVLDGRYISLFIQYDEIQMDNQMVKLFKWQF